MPILRKHIKDPQVVVPTRLAHDSQISLAARGLWLILDIVPEGKAIDVEWLADHTRTTPELIKQYLFELHKAGWLNGNQE